MLTQTPKCLKQNISSWNFHKTSWGRGKTTKNGARPLARTTRGSTFLKIVLKKIIGGQNTLRRTNAGCGNFARLLEVPSGRYKVTHKRHTKVAIKHQSVSDLRATSLRCELSSGAPRRIGEGLSGFWKFQEVAWDQELLAPKISLGRGPPRPK